MQHAHFLYHGLVGIALALSSLAPLKAQPYDQGGYPATATQWNGFYAGVHAGGGFGKAGRADTSGFVGGAQGGVNLQFDQGNCSLPPL
jgi:opacity protein-like surface antigen